MTAGCRFICYGGLWHLIALLVDIVIAVRLKLLFLALRFRFAYATFSNRLGERLSTFSFASSLGFFFPLLDDEGQVFWQNSRHFHKFVGNVDPFKMHFPNTTDNL
jgi:hypothetical protein